MSFFDTLNSSIKAHTHFENSAQRIDGYSIYRSDRFLASFAQQSLSLVEKNAWKEALHQNALNAYRLEVSRLPMSSQKSLAAFVNAKTMASGIIQCSSDLVDYHAKKEKTHPLNYERIHINDSYSEVSRFFGLYFITQYLAQPYIDNYQEDMTTLYYRGQTDDSPTQFYQPKQRITLSSQHIKKTLFNAYNNNALGIPVLTKISLAQLFSHFSPNLSLENNNTSDQIGSPKWGQDGRLWVDTREPRTYTFTSYTRYKGDVLLQLNYGFWFPERPAQTGFDIYAGDLDGIIWRVTLDTQGQPLVYDSIHQCGCYHKVYLLAETSINTSISSIEPPLYFDIDIDTSLPLTLNTNSSSHYIVGVSQTDHSNKDSIRYDLTSYDALSQLIAMGRKKSLFGDDGIIEQSARKERWFLWPLGVVNAGAMRQKGNHAVAFIGRRHFDDAFLWEKLNVRRNSP
ncbi:MAG: hypothetical protein JKY01_13525 [Pseudomonadales bacterium]|nr:hypothetical protein [Pseudomonadales bacterium]